MTYNVRYWKLEENLPVGEAGDMMATLYVVVML